MLAAATRDRSGRMPPPKGYVRKVLTVPPQLAAAVKNFRFEQRLENDVEAYRLLIQKGLEAHERESKREREEQR